MDGARDLIREAGGDVVAVFQYRAQPTRNFCRRRGVALDCFGDPERRAYRAAGVERGGVARYIGPRTISHYARAIRKGHLPGVPKGDTAQLGATFVVGPDGRVLLAHYDEHAGDHPSLDAILEAVRAGARRTNVPRSPL